MRRDALIALAAGSTVLAAPASAQMAGQTPAPTPPPVAQGATQTTTPAAEPAKPDDPSTATETKADANVKSKTAGAAPPKCGTLITAGPNQGQILHRCKRKDN
jgi:hypothetical protein